MEVIDKMMLTIDVIMSSQWIFVPVLLVGGMIGNAVSSKMKSLGGHFIK